MLGHSSVPVALGHAVAFLGAHRSRVRPSGLVASGPAAFVLPPGRAGHGCRAFACGAAAGALAATVGAAGAMRCGPVVPLEALACCLEARGGGHPSAAVPEVHPLDRTALPTHPDHRAQRVASASHEVDRRAVPWAASVDPSAPADRRFGAAPLAAAEPAGRAASRAGVATVAPDARARGRWAVAGPRAVGLKRPSGY